MVMRLSGFSNSGIDIDETVKKLVAAARIPQDKLKQQKQWLEWQRDDYRTINTKILAFRSAASDMTRQAAFLTKKSTSADDSVVSVTSSATAPDGIFSIKVNKLATSASVTSEKVGASSDTATLSTLDAAFTQATTLTIGGEKGTATINVKPTDTIASLVANVNGKSSTTGVTMSYDANLDRFFFTSSSTGSKAAIDLKMDSEANGHNLLTSVLKLTSGQESKITGNQSFATGLTTVIDSSIDPLSPQKFHIAAGGESFDYDVTDTTTIGDLIDQINNSDVGKKAGVTAYLDENNKLAFHNPDKSKPITITDATVGGSTLLTTLGVDSTTETAWPLSTGSVNKGGKVTGTQAFASGSTTLIDGSLASTQKFHIEANGKTFDYDVTKTTTIGQLIDQINSSDIGKSGVSAYLDKDNKLAFYNPDQTKPITVTDGTSDSYNLVDKLGMTSPTSTTDLDYGSYRITGQQAEIVYNGVTANYDTNNFSISGMNITIKKESSSAVNITNTRDVDTVFNSIKSFVDKYNELIDTVNTKTTEKRNRDFSPLTDEQREAMKDDQITQWEAKAKSGTLYGDSILRSGLTNFRTAFSNSIDGLPSGDYKSLSQIGISTANVSGTSISGSYLDNGKIYIDEDKLKKAISENPDQVMALFTANDGLKDSNKGDGLARRLSDQADALFKNISAKAGVTGSVDTTYIIGKSLKDLNTRIDDFSTKLDDLETRYYNQFTAMEKYMNQMEAQSAQLSQQWG
ncbi:flagellar filament capping protein FliD [Paenibacillus oryzisoli]|uniref:flagellar filament capping protein FliD n=1 Tax=Paenibacillus oryzisoli TaxID=1850517 RepID=UPI003D2DFA1A